MKKITKLFAVIFMLSFVLGCFTACGDVPVESLVLSHTGITINVGDTKAVTCTVMPDDATNKTVIWSSSNTAVAMVSNVGVITAVGAGNCIITASSGNVIESVIVTVKKPVEQVVLNKTEVTIKEGETFSFVCTIVPNDASEKNITWTSSDSSIATVNNNGTVTGIKAGTCTIKASCDGKSVVANVTIKEKGPDLKKLYNELSSQYGWTLGSDNSYLSADTNVYNSNNYTNYSILAEIEDMNKKMGLPDSLYNDMLRTTWSMGKQQETFENVGVKVTWTYHPDKGLEVTYKLINN